MNKAHADNPPPYLNFFYQKTITGMIINNMMRHTVSKTRMYFIAFKYFILIVYFDFLFSNPYLNTSINIVQFVCL